MKRIFLAWDKLPLEAVSEFFVNQFTENGCLDMRRAVLVLPGKRAADRLEEVFAEKAETLPDTAWYPPKFVSVDDLPEQFYEAKKEFASPLVQILVWIQALDQIENEHPDELRVLLAKRPNSGSIEARLTFGKMFNTLHTELASDLQNFSLVAKLCDKLNLPSEKKRWEALWRLEEKYLAILDAKQIWDKQAARLYAVEHPEEFNAFYRKHKENKTQFFLVGCTDLNSEQKQILYHFADIVTAVVFAPFELENAFDEYGCLKPEAWQPDKFAVPLDKHQIFFADKPEEQADVLVQMIAPQLNTPVQNIVVSSPDDGDLPAIQGKFETAGIPIRYVPGKPVQQTPIYRFLECWAAYKKLQGTSPLYAAFAALVRHPAVDSWLKEANLLKRLDLCYNEHLPLTVSDIPASDKVYPVIQRLNTLLAADNTADSIERVLQTLFPKDKQTSQYKTVVQKLQDVQNAIKKVEDFSDTDVLQLLLFQLAGVRIAPPADHSAVEIIGWLDTALDDAQAVIITGFNDGKIPDSKTADMFLPDKVRQLLHIEDNRKRYARDAYNLSVILASRPQSNVRVLACKHGAAGDPLLPSRLMFAADDKTTLQRVKRFFCEETKGKEKESIAADCGSGEKRPKQKIPLLAEAIDIFLDKKSLSITDFKKYIECPYRFYLQKILYLSALDDSGEEMEAATFGSLVHYVLDDFGKNENIKDRVDVDKVREYLLQKLDERADVLFGKTPRVSVAIQIERAAYRLKAFAEKQVEWRKQGYVIQFTEREFNDAALELPTGEPMKLKARIDRIDRHEKTGEWVVFDYKTGSSEPEEAHRKGKKEKKWIDLQLPLYDYVLRNVKDGEFTGKIRLGYFLLPKDVDKTGIILAKWEPAELDEAVEKAKEVARNIRECNFAMAEKPPLYDDFAEICRLY
ncbi:MAG: PD-(D/E)XK nuclease family protein [Planctomycetaceae bacterium]|jgi:RecB family exonuclease|nr:PD-(D/E)XK nuclease family protein [Planctomycetaceae bacterium]